MKTLDELRDAHPTLGFALYAYDAVGPVTLEVHTPDGQTYSFVGRTEALAIGLAFPEPVYGSSVAGDMQRVMRDANLTGNELRESQTATIVADPKPAVAAYKANETAAYVVNSARRTRKKTLPKTTNVFD